MTRIERPENSGADLIRAAIPASLILLLAALPPHVHPAVLAPALALASLAGLIALPLCRVPLATAAFCLVAIALNLATSIQSLQSIRTMALATAFVLTGLCCAGLGHGTGARGARLVLLAVVLAGTALALSGLNQALFVFATPPEGGAVSEAIRARIASGRAVGTLGLPAALGGFLAMSIPVTAMWVLRGNAGTALRIGAGILVAIQAAGLVATRSASALAALGIGGAIVVWRLARERRGASRRNAVIAAVTIAAVGIAIAAAILALRLAGPTAADEGSGPMMLRALNWKVALEIFAGSPILGAGAGCYGIAFPALREWGMNESRFAHNSYLQILAEGGLLLGLPILIAAALFARRIWRAVGAGGDAALLGLACLTFMVHNVVDFTLFLPTTGMVFACLAGLIAPSARATDAPGSLVRPAAAGARATDAPGSLVRPAAAVALVLAMVAVTIGTADRARDASRDLLAERRLDEALGLARRASRLNPIDPDARALESQLLLEKAAASRDPEGLPLAEALAWKAVQLDPVTPGRWRHLGRVRLARGDLLGAYLALARAAALYPIRIEYREERNQVRDRIARSAEPE